MVNLFDQLLDPTPDEIRVACLSIQNHWSPRERRRRRLSGKLRRMLIQRACSNVASIHRYGEMVLA
jgi:hypothetical protein